MTSPPSPNHPTVVAGPDEATGDADRDDPVDGRAHAAIDIGTNSVHLLVARSTADQRFEVLAQEKEVVRLGHGANDMRELSDAAIDRGIAALRRFGQLADIWAADITAVATSAVREADNHEVFIRRAREEAGIEVEIISGVEEARLIHIGVLHALPVFDQRLLVVDIGGGSTELVIGEQGRTIDARSLKLGAIRLTDRFFAGDETGPSQVAACRQYVRAFLGPAVHDLGVHGFDVAAGSSGTIETLATMAVARRGSDRPRSVSNIEFTTDELAGVIDLLVSVPTVDERAKLPGMDAKRADIIVAGAIVLEQVAAAMGVESLLVSNFALREGVLLDRLHQVRGSSLHHLSDLRRTSVLHVAALDPDREHSEHLTELALGLFDETRDLHGLDDHHRELLEAAGLLHNVGLFINHSAHHKHSYYVIRNSEQLLGFTDHEIELIALIARYHRKSAPKPKHPEWAGLDDADRPAVSVLAGLLRVAIGLDRSHSLVIRDVSADVDPDTGTLRIVAIPVDESDPSLEIYSANERAELLAGSLDLDVEVVLAGS
ncbi:MAG: Ppx/GppA phosphatase family protein [Acidimicrobiales bacterium]|nr:Ppx/GppA phosphatase family protein [Acidimicrobiales bacterium]